MFADRLRGRIARRFLTHGLVTGEGELQMKFSIIYEAQMVDTSRANEAQSFRTWSTSRLGRRDGFDCIWSVEHHCLTQYAHLSAPESFLAFVAGRTTRIHVGHGVVCLPFKMNHPIKVAERVATLDLLSRGRLHFGVGKGVRSKNRRLRHQA